MSDKIVKPNKIIYLDNAATTPLNPEVYLAMQPYLQTNFGNPSSLHQLGRAAAHTLNQARQTIATSLQVKPNEIIFTGSGTESDNLAILGLARANQDKGNHIIVSAIEHKAVLEAAKTLEKEGFKVTYLPVDKHGLIEIDTLTKALTDQTILVSIMYANNEIGTIEPIREIVDTVHKHYPDSQPPLIHTDACQAVGMLPVYPSDLGVDAMTINSSKIYGPKGIGLLYLKSGTKITPLVVGGDQENHLRAGTENIALAIGFAVALQKAITATTKNYQKLSQLQAKFITQITTAIPDVILNGHPTNRLPNNIHLCIPDIEGESIILMLDAQGVCASTGSACSSLDLEPSYVLSAIGRDDNIIHGSIRFSLGLSTTQEELTQTVVSLAKIIKTLKAMTASPLPLTHKKYGKHT